MDWEKLFGIKFLKENEDFLDYRNIELKKTPNFAFFQKGVSPWFNQKSRFFCVLPLGKMDRKKEFAKVLQGKWRLSIKTST